MRSSGSTGFWGTGDWGWPIYVFACIWLFCNAEPGPKSVQFPWEMHHFLKGMWSKQTPMSFTRSFMSASSQRSSSNSELMSDMSSMS